MMYSFASNNLSRLPSSVGRAEEASASQNSEQNGEDASIQQLLATFTARWT